MALLEAAEHLIAADGPAALSVRRVADTAGTSPRAVYSLFGSKDGLIVALGIRTFDLLRDSIDALPVTDDPVDDLVEAGMTFRRFVLQHPALFQLGFQQVDVPPELAEGFAGAAERALESLLSRAARMAGATSTGARSLRADICGFHALCEGLAALELRGMTAADDAEQIWRDALTALVRGWGEA